MKKLRKIFGSQNYSKGLTRSQQNQFAQTMGELLLSGFSLQESLYLLLTIRSFPPVILANIQHQLKEGQAFSEVLSQIGYGAEQLVQIELAERHGNLPTTLLEIAKQFRLVEGFRNDLKKLLAYPMLLLTFLLGILFSMRLFVLPQLIGSGMVMQEHWGIQLIQVFHWYVLLFILAVTLLALLVRYRLMKLSPVDQSEWISRQLLIGPIYSLYQSAYLSLEIGKLFHEGFELRQIIVCLKETKQESLIQHLASKLIQGLEAGMSLAEQFQKTAFQTSSSLDAFYSANHFFGRSGFDFISLCRCFITCLRKHRGGFAMKKRKISYYSGFTLIEMLIVLLIISVLVLLFVPNLSRYRNHVDQESREAIIQLVDTQKELYALQNNGRVPTVEELLNEGYIKREHAEIYQRP